MKMRNIALFCLMFISGCLTAQTQVSTHTAGVTPDGATFFLPKTAIRISVLVEKSIYQPGDYAVYAQKFLRLNNVSTEPSTTYRVLSVNQYAVGVADTTKAFSIKFNNKTSAINIALADDGVLLAINAQPSEPWQFVPFAPAPKQPVGDLHKLLTEEILTAGSTAKMAQLTAQEIYDLRENRNLLIKGQADFMPQDGAQMRLMLDQIDRQDKLLTSMFSGTTTCDTTEHVFMVYPQENVNNRQLFRFSRHFGIVDADDLSGSPYYITLTDLNSVPKAVVNPKDKRKDKAENGLYYNVPGSVRSVISDFNQMVVSQADFPAAQFGNVELLSGDLFNKHYSTRLWLNPLTGNIDRLEAEQPK